MELSPTTKANKVRRLKKHLTKCIHSNYLHKNDTNSIQALKSLGINTNIERDPFNHKWSVYFS